jgi:C4-dicarboxylate-specific signal transduction histidine kinase
MPLNGESREGTPQTEQTQQTAMANIGEVAGPVVHELNNFLNSLVLHLAVLETKLPVSLRGHLDEIRGSASNVAVLLRQFQHYSEEQLPASQATDLHQVLIDVLSTMRKDRGDGTGSGSFNLVPQLTAKQSKTDTQTRVPARLTLASDPQMVQGSVADVRRLVSFLLSNFVATAAAADGQLDIRTENAGGAIILQVEDTGPPLRSESFVQFFDPQGACREGTRRLELAACKRIVHRLQGKIRCENGSKGGIAVTVELRRA